MSFVCRRAVIPLATRLLAAACALTAIPAHATAFELIYTGAFNAHESLNLASDSTPAFFTASTPYTIHALFDDATPNLAPNFGGSFDGFRAYAPSSATIEIAGTRYTIENSTANPTAGVTVAIFDQNSFTLGRYGIGLIADPVGDGAGIVGDFVSASPDFTVAALTATVFTGFAGVGHSSGVCTSGTAPACPHAITPWVLHDGSNAAWNLTLGNYSEDYPIAHSPGASIGPLNTAQIVAVPEASIYGSMFAGLVGLVVALRRRVR